MKSRVAFPFLRIPDDGPVTDARWTLGAPDEPLEEAPDFLRHWDYGRKLKVSLRFTIDLEAVAKCLQISRDELALRSVLKYGTGGRGQFSQRVKILDERPLGAEDSDITLEGPIDSSALSGRLQLDGQIILDAPPINPDSLSPRFPGARLWQMRKNVLLEGGSASRFPMEYVSFKDHPSFRKFAQAPWYIKWDPHHLDHDFGSNFRLYVNEDNEEVAGQVAEGDPFTLTAILADTMNLMISNIVDDPECSARLEESLQLPSSTGTQISSFMKSAFETTETETIATLRRDSPGKFSARIFDAARIT